LQFKYSTASNNPAVTGVTDGGDAGTWFHSGTRRSQTRTECSAGAARECHTRLERLYSQPRSIRQNKLALLHGNSTVWIVGDQNVSIQIRVVNQRRKMRCRRDTDRTGNHA